MVEQSYTPLDEQVTNILDDHSAALLDGEDHGGELVREHGEEFPALVELIGIAQRLRETFVPVRPDEAFVTDLRTRLNTMSEKDGRAVTVWSRVRGKLSQRSAVLGTVISVLAVLAMAFRVVGSLLMVIVLVSGSRRRRAAAA